MAIAHSRRTRGEWDPTGSGWYSVDYTYSGDQSSGQTNGQGVGGTWYVVSSTGQIVQPGAVQPGGVPGSTATTSHGATTTTRSTSTSTSKPTTTTTKPTTTTKKPASDETVPSDG